MVVRFMEADRCSLNGYLCHVVGPVIQQEGGGSGDIQEGDGVNADQFYVQLDGAANESAIAIPRDNLFHIRPAAWLPDVL